MTDAKASRADFWTGLFWIVFGGAIIAMSARMPIPRHLGATEMTAPGLVPALLGAGLMILGAVLSLRAWRGLAIESPEGAVDPNSVSTSRPVVAGAMMISYALALTYGLPFIALTVVFVTLFIVSFNWHGRTQRQRLLTFLGAVVMAAIFAATLEFVFEQLFYVRLP